MSTTKSERSYFSPVGLAMKLAKAFEAVGFSPEEINSIAEETTLLYSIHEVGKGSMQFTVRPYKVLVHAPDPPFLGARRSEGCPPLPLNETEYEVVKQNGAVFLNGKELRLFLTPEQMQGNCTGRIVQTAVINQDHILPSILLDFFVKNPGMWPESWKYWDGESGPEVAFWGDQFDGVGPSINDVFVRTGKWTRLDTVEASLHQLSGTWTWRFPAATLNVP